MRIHAKALSAVVLFLFAGAAVAGGGFWITTYSPRAPIAAGIPDAVVVVGSDGCGGGAGATLSGTAEGLVNGKRQSVALLLTPTPKPGIFAVRRQWPSEGAWVLVMKAERGQISTGALIAVRPDGEAKMLRAKSAMPPPVSAAEVETALHRLAAAETETAIARR